MPPPPCDVDRLDKGVRMGTAQTLADEDAGLPEIGAKSCAIGHLVLAIRPDGTLADALVVRADRIVMQELCVADGVQVGIQGDVRNTSIGNGAAKS
jgi:hypothetical protein